MNFSFLALFEKSNPSILRENVSSLMLHISQLGVKGSLSVDHITRGEVFTTKCIKYKDEFNFAHGGRFEDWHFDEEKVTIQEKPNFYDYY